uniref:TIGR00341 family protein n=1 Tax=Desulfacinum infernum TaxID=35837 RepID=A0A832A159_9BACT
MFNADSDTAWQESVRENIRKGAELNTAFIFMNVLAATIACYGLFTNSPAIIIGAMIVAMLLGPIAGLSLSLVDSDIQLLLRSLLTLLSGTIVVLLISFIIGMLHRDIPITSEILARTNPNHMDLMVALAGGAAGAYASVSPRLSAALVGVAIATALVPPLSSASILFAHGAIHLGLGALLLAFTNMVAIQFASSVVLWLAGFRRLSHTSGLSFLVFLKRNAINILILIALAVLLTKSLHTTVAHQIFKTKTEETLRQIIDRSEGYYLADLRVDRVQDKTTQGTTIVRAIVRGPLPPSPDQVAAMEAQLPPPPDGTAMELRIRFVPTTIINRNGYVYKDARLVALE